MYKSGVSDETMSKREKQLFTVVCGLMVFFGWSSWLFVNSAFVELPLIGPIVPESWDIASHMSLAIQAGNIFPLTYVLLRWLCRREVVIEGVGVVERTISARLTVLFILLVNVVISFLMVFNWDKTLLINGSEVSVFILGSMFLGGGVSSLSNLTYWSFGAKFKSAHIMSALSVGVGASSVIPAIFGFIQNPGENPLYGVGTHFGIMTGFLVLSLFGYVLSAYIRSFNVLKKDVMYLETDLIAVSEEPSGDKICELVGSSSNVQGESSWSNGNVQNSYGTSRDKLKESSDGEISAKPKLKRSQSVRLSRYHLFMNHKFSFSVMFWISYFNFFVFGILPYVAKVFGNDQQMVLRWITIVGMISGTVGRIASSFFKEVPNFWLAVFQTVCFGLLFVFGSPLGISSIALIVCKLVMEFLFALNCTMLYKQASNQYIVDSEQAQRICRYLAVGEQMGSVTGTLTQFFLVQNGYLKG